MTSSFTWLDYSEHNRQRMMQAIDLFAEQATRDELGIGTVRDAFSDLLFPGTSVVQRFARYLLFVPWMYMELERRRVPTARVALLARQEETKLIEVLEQADSGIPIGHRARGNC